jgi:transcription initiation factor TFIIE subunit alpha
LRKKQEEEEAKRRMQQEGKISVPDSQTERQVGKKYKRDDDDEGIEWEEHQPTGTGFFWLLSFSFNQFKFSVFCI